MDSADRLADALRDTLNEIALAINQAQSTQPVPVAAVVVAEAGIAGVTERADRPERLLYPLGEVRERLGGISRSTLYSLLGSGELVPVKIGSRSFITAENLQAYVQRLTQTAAARTR